MKVWILSKRFVDPPSLLKFGSKNRYQSPESAPRFLFQYYQNEYQKSTDLGFDPSPQIPYFNIKYKLDCLRWRPDLAKERKGQ